MNGIGRLLFVTVTLTSALQVTAASRFDPSGQPLGAVAPLVLSGTDLSNGSEKAYRPWFENGSWQGDIVEYSVSSEGALTTSVDLRGTSPLNPGNNPDNWSAYVQFAAAEDNNTNYWDTGRKIVSWNGSRQVAFRWSTGTIGETNMGLLDPTALAGNATSSNVLNYVRGQRTKEYPEVTALRARGSILGDIIH
jgi:Tfp pilus tip-associated adhesin PilY1